jgi:hypothetical protein
VICRETKSVVGDDLDHAATRNLIARALLDHPRELVTKRGQMDNATIDLLQLLASNPVGVNARTLGVIRKIEKLAYGFHGKPELARMADKRQASTHGVIIEPLISFRSWCGRQ